MELYFFFLSLCVGSLDCQTLTCELVETTVFSGSDSSLSVLVTIKQRVEYEPRLEIRNKLSKQICVHTHRDDVKLAQLVKARDCRSRGRRSDSGTTPKN